MDVLKKKKKVGVSCPLKPSRDPGITCFLTTLMGSSPGSQDGVKVYFRKGIWKREVTEAFKGLEGLDAAGVVDRKVPLDFESIDAASDPSGDKQPTSASIQGFCMTRVFWQ